MIHLLFLPIYIQAMTVQNQNCSGFFVLKILERIKINIPISDSIAELISTI